MRFFLVVALPACVVDQIAVWMLGITDIIASVVVGLLIGFTYATLIGLPMLRRIESRKSA